MFNIGIIGCGNIASKMAEAIRLIDGISVAAVASRDKGKAKKFAAQHCPDAKIYEGYEKLAAASGIDLVYIATPNTYHYENAIMCIKEYKNVLIEKPFSMSKGEADSIFAEAKNRNLFVCEAMWTSFMPLHEQMLKWISDGRIGAVRYISADLGYDLTDVDRLNDPVLGGGAYLDLGVYPTNLALSVLGDDIRLSRAFGRKLSTGCERDACYCLESLDVSALASFYVTMCANTVKDGTVVGETGKIKITNINTYRKIELYTDDDVLIEESEADGDIIRAYTYEVKACAEAIRKGLIQCRQMPWQKSSKLAEINDSVRAMM